MATTLDALTPQARDLASGALAWMDGHWDGAAGLLRDAADEPAVPVPPGVRLHLVRETAWYALGLLLRGGPGDRERAVGALGTVLAHQFDAPGRPYHGTFARFPEEPTPPAAPREWLDYDPNWREFIGTTLALILLHAEDLLPPELVRGIDAALRLAIAGALPRRVPASYTNIALMQAFLLSFAADRYGEPGWAAAAETLGGAVHDRFRAHGAFDEYNSPTYYGVDLYALALWREHAPSPALRELGAALEGALWTDIARYYHAGLRNLCGPYDRAYGMDLRRYAGLLGLWIWLVTGAEAAPFPDWRRPFAHANDFCLAPCVAVLGARVPEAARPHFAAFQGERQVEQALPGEPPRRATAWLGPQVMIGAEAGGKPGWKQFHPATVHWRAPGGEVGWLRLRHTAPVDARATPNTLTIASDPPTAETAYLFEIHAPGLAPDAIGPDRWRLPGLTVHVETTAHGPTATRRGELVELHYSAGERAPGSRVTFTLRTEPESGVGSRE